MQHPPVNQRPCRLAKREAFVRVQGRGQRFRGAHLCVLMLRSPEQRTAVGFTVSRRVGNAVVRNRVRRRLKEMMRLDRDRLPSAGEIVIIAFPSAARVDYASLRTELLCLIDRAHAWAQPQASSSASLRCIA